MKRLGQLLRLFYINYVIARRGLDRVVLSAPYLSPWRFLGYLNPWNWVKSQKSRGASIRLALEDLGPVFVKFGQILSTRYDLLPEDVIGELSKLQDQVPSFSSEIAQRLVEQALGRPLDELFCEFSTTPLASASIAQVHAATLHDGRKVVVKIQRPGIAKTIRRDLSILYTVAGLAERFWSHGRRLKARAMVAEFENTLADELDFMREAANASQLRRNFLYSPVLYIPEVYWQYTTAQIIVMERISGIPIADIDALLAQGIDLKKLAEHGVEIFFNQVFRDNFFHADMHPGNIFAKKDATSDPCYIAVDFGIVGSLSPKDQHYLAENLLAFFKRDYRKVAVLHVASGWVPPDTRVEQFESAIRSVCEPIFEKPLRDISFAQLLLSLFQTASRFKMEIQPQLFLLQKTLLNIEGLGRRLYPELDIWIVAKPILERWVKQRYGIRATLKTLRQQGPGFIEKLMALPELCYDVFEHKKKLQLIAEWQANSVDKKVKKTGLKFFFFGVGFGFIWVALIYWGYHV